MSTAKRLREAGETAWWLRAPLPAGEAAEVYHFPGPCTRRNCRGARRNRWKQATAAIKKAKRLDKQAAKAPSPK